MTASLSKIRYTAHGAEWDYEPRYSLNTLDWFNLAKCARARMSDYAVDVHRWRNERYTFYKALQHMKVDEVVFMEG